jgi:hypothetical protein
VQAPRADCHHRAVAALDAFLCFCAGVFLNMSVLHLFRHEETATHPMIRMWRRPRLASAIWGCIQLLAGALILLVIGFRFALDLETLLLLAGFCFWSLLGAILVGQDRPGGDRSG